MSTETIKLPQEVEALAKGVSVEKRNEVQNVLNHVFNGVSKMRDQLDLIEVEDENDKTAMQMARSVRLGVREVRLNAEKDFDAKRQEVQQAMLSFKTEDSLWLKAKQTMQILTKEIEQTAKWKEDTKDRIEAERLELKVQERLQKVHKFNSEINRDEISSMSDETFKSFLSGIEKDHNDKIEAEKKAEAERIAKEKAEAEAREKQRLENIRLKEEAEKREKEIAIEKAKVEAERKKQAEIQAKKDAEIEAKLKAEREKQSKLEAELKAKRDAELNAQKEKEKAEAEAKKQAEKLAKAPVKKQLSLWVESFEIPLLSIEHDKAKEIVLKFEAFKKWAKKEVDNI